jgi:hypothetical protein
MTNTFICIYTMFTTATISCLNFNVIYTSKLMFQHKKCSIIIRPSVLATFQQPSAAIVYLRITVYKCFFTNLWVLQKRNHKSVYSMAFTWLAVPVKSLMGWQMWPNMMKAQDLQQGRPCRSSSG